MRGRSLICFHWNWNCSCWNRSPSFFYTFSLLKQILNELHECQLANSANSSLILRIERGAQYSFVLCNWTTEGNPNCCEDRFSIYNSSKTDVSNFFSNSVRVY